MIKFNHVSFVIIYKLQYVMSCDQYVHIRFRAKHNQRTIMWLDTLENNAQVLRKPKHPADKMCSAITRKSVY